MHFTPRDFIACIVWTVAASIMVFGTLIAADKGATDGRVALSWGLFLAVVAHQIVGWAVLRRHHSEQEVSVERIVEIVDALHSDRHQPRRLH